MLLLLLLSLLLMYLILLSFMQDPGENTTALKHSGWGRIMTWSRKDQHAAMGSEKDSHPLFASLG